MRRASPGANEPRDNHTCNPMEFFGRPTQTRSAPKIDHDLQAYLSFQLVEVKWSKVCLLSASRDYHAGRSLGSPWREQFQGPAARQQCLSGLELRKQSALAPNKALLQHHPVISFLLLSSCHLDGCWIAQDIREKPSRWLALLPLAVVQGHGTGLSLKTESRSDSPSKQCPPSPGSTMEASMAQAE